jgi:ubiquinone/menaquinone biosynthesis C-methylase UbiE
MAGQQVNPAGFGTSTGHVLAEAGYLDDHYATCRAEYEAMLRSVGLQSGWHVLDAGCGGGSFLPLMADLVGPTGRITALDLAPENVDRVEARIATGHLCCPVKVDPGDILALPYANDTFDAVWTANVSQYFTDEDLEQALAEICRVVRPGGLVALKEADTRLCGLDAGDPRLIWRWLAAREAMPQRGCWRSRSLHRWLERAGLRDVWQRTTFVERYAPLNTAERPFLASILSWFASEAQTLPVPETDKARWRTLADETSPDYLLDQSDYCYCEGSVVTVGRVP